MTNPTPLKKQLNTATIEFDSWSQWKKDAMKTAIRGRAKESSETQTRTTNTRKK